MGAQAVEVNAGRIDGIAPAAWAGAKSATGTDLTLPLSPRCRPTILPPPDTLQSVRQNGQRPSAPPRRTRPSGSPPSGNPLSAGYRDASGPVQTAPLHIVRVRLSEDPAGRRLQRMYVIYISTLQSGTDLMRERRPKPLAVP
jgi:hypothetical protein